MEMDDRQADGDEFFPLLFSLSSPPACALCWPLALFILSALLSHCARMDTMSELPVSMQRCTRGNTEHGFGSSHPIVWDASSKIISCRASFLASRLCFVSFLFFASIFLLPGCLHHMLCDERPLKWKKRILTWK